MLDFNFAEVIADLGPDPAFRLANRARPGPNYLFARFLPETPRMSYQAKAGTMTIRTTMAGLAGMDSPYPPAGLIESGEFLEEAMKVAGETSLSEAALRRLQEIIMELQLRGTGSKETLASEVINFTDKVLIQSMMDRTEWLRAQALVNGEIDWTFNKINWKVTYGIPSDNILSERTGTEAWDESGSEFWADVALLYEKLHYDVRAFVIHPDTLLAVTANEANNLEIINQETFAAGGSRTTVRRLLGDNERPSRDFRHQVTLVAYGDEAEVYDTSDPGRTTKVPFMPQKKLLAIGAAGTRGYVVGEGSTADPRDELAIGYTHLAPTVEGGGSPGRWAQVYTPENAPMQLRGRFASNVVPVIENPELIAVASSEIGGS
ncbi:MAG: major capsid protein [Chloroflexota bacterium]